MLKKHVSDILQNVARFWIELIEVIELRLAAGAQSFGGCSGAVGFDVLPGKSSKAKEAGSRGEMTTR